MLQKIIQVGNSLGVTLPKEFVVKHKLKSGSKITVSQMSDEITFSTRLPRETKYQMTSDAEFTSLIKEVEAQYGDALDELAHLE